MIHRTNITEQLPTTLNFLISQIVWVFPQFQLFMVLNNIQNKKYNCDTIDFVLVKKIIKNTKTDGKYLKIEGRGLLIRRVEIGSATHPNAISTFGLFFFC